MAKKISNTQERLEEMMKELNIIPADIARKTGINKSTLSNYLSGKRKAVQDQLSKIADAYNIDPAWLMGYDVPMRMPASIEDYDSERVKRAIAYYQMFENLPPEKQSQFEDFLKFLQSRP